MATYDNSDKRCFLCGSFITELVLSCNYSAPTPPIIGFDVEFKESDGDGTHCKPATLQLCSGSRCIIIQLNRVQVVPQALFNLLSAPLFCFVGVGVCGKLSALRRNYGLQCRNFVELAPFLNLAFLNGCLELEPKPLNVIIADWGAENLSVDQIKSAASNAHTFFEFGKIALGLN